MSAESHQQSSASAETHQRPRRRRVRQDGEPRAIDLIEEDANAKPFPRIMVPLVGSIPEFTSQATAIKGAADNDGE